MQPPPPPRNECSTIVGLSPWTHHVRALIADVAPYASNVLIIGPSGTGKELIARAIHAHSPRATNRFIPVDCASVSGPLFASHLFGHVRGAFTGATHSAVGCFRAADRGTIFLDEVGELDGELQAKMLRVLQERTVVPVGSHEGTRVDVRIVAATNRNLAHAVANGGFRLDLYYRLNVVVIPTLPLRERTEDIPVLARHFLAKSAVNNGLPSKMLSEAASEALQRHDWPGNVRELENVLERATLCSSGDIIDAEAVRRATADHHTFPAAPPISAAPEPGQSTHWPTAAEVEREHILKTLEHVGHNLSAAARLLDIDRHQLRRRIRKYGLDVSCSKSRRLPK